MKIVKQAPCAVKQITRPMFGFKSLRYARLLIADIENYAHDSRRSAQRNQRPSTVRNKPVLLAGVLVGVGHAAKLGLVALLRQNHKTLHVHLSLLVANW